MLKKRFVHSVFSNIVRGILGFLISMYLAKELGPGEYGRYAYIFMTTLALKSIFELGSSSFFFTYISQKPRSFSFIINYWLIIIFNFIILSVLLFVLLPEKILNVLWVHESKVIVFVGLIATFLQGTIWNLGLQMAEASRRTLSAGFVQSTVLLLYLISLVILRYLDQLTLLNIFVLIIFLWFFGSVLLFNFYSFEKDEKNTTTLRRTFSHVFRDSKPLIIVTIFTAIYEIVDRTLLQAFSGSVEQGYFSVAQQFSLIILFATTAVVKIFWKEIAEANFHGDFHRLFRLYKTVSEGVFFVSACLGFAIITVLPDIIRIYLGEDYIKAQSVMMVMLMIPLHQALGQLNTTFLLASSNYSIYARTTIISVVISVVTVYFVLAPNTNYIPGLNFGALGLAIKVLLIQLITVNLLGYFIHKKFNWVFDWKFQFIYVLFFGIIAAIVYYIFSVVLFEFVTSVYLMIALKLFFYFLTTGFLIFFFPGIINLDKYRLRIIVRQNWDELRNKTF